MKRFVFAFIVFLLAVIPCHSQPDKEPAVNIEDMPFPEGGIDAFKSWINDNNRYKKISDTINESEQVYVQFTVDTTGSLKDVVVVRGFEPAYDKEAVRLILSCPIKWTPAKREGKKVAVELTMPISFTEKTSKSIKAIEKRNKSLILKANEEIFNNGNLAFADEVFASFYYNDRGPEYIKDRVSALKTAFPDLWVVVQPVLAEGSLVAWRRDHSGTHEGEYMGFPPTGKEIYWHSIIISHIVDSVIVAEWASSNMVEVLQKNKLENE
jgi:TonB family protein